jgi:phytoene dehydrogenase-like protein
MTERRFDAIVVGAGHNGLVAAAYLARAGLDVAVVERRPLVGGACVTEELIPGTRSSSCAFVAAPGLHPKVLADLELAAHGLAMYQTPVLSCVMHAGREPLVVYAAVDRALREISRLFGRREAEGYLALGARLRRFAGLVRPDLLRGSPSLAELEARAGGDRTLVRDFTERSIRELLDRYLEADELRGMLAYLALTGVHGGPSTPGTSYVFAYHAWGEYDGRFGESAFVRGGMGAISNAIASAARAHGAVIRTSTPVSRIVVRDGVTRGVVCEDGTEFAAPLVLSNADPQRTFLSLIDPAELDPAFVTAVRALDFRGSLGRVHIAVDRLPHFTAARPLNGAEYAGWTLLDATMAGLERAALHQERGELDPDGPVPIELLVQSAHDSSLAPDGQHVIVAGVQQLPSDLRDGTWDEHASDLTSRVVDTLERFAPDVRARIVATRAITPRDLERTYGLTGGNLFHGGMTPEQVLERRRLPGCGDYETPIAGLYLCGSGTHPGGAVTGIPGHNAARVALGVLARAHRFPAERAPSRRTAVTSSVDRILGLAPARRLAVRAAESPRLGAVLRRLGQ